MLTLVRYASWLFMTHVGLMLFGFVSLLQLLDILNNTEEIIVLHGTGVQPLLRYAWLRLPEPVVYMMPFSVLMGSMLAVARLAQHNEVLALKAAGLSFYRLLIAFVPAALIAAGLHFLLSDRLAPVASRALVQWDAAASAGNDMVEPPSEQEVWVRDGPTLIRVAVVFGEGRELHGVTLFRRDEIGNLTERITARAARFTDGAWHLYGVEQLKLVPGSGGVFSRHVQQPWSTALTPGHFSDLATPPSGLSLAELIH